MISSILNCVKNSTINGGHFGLRLYKEWYYVYTCFYLVSQMDIFLPTLVFIYFSISRGIRNSNGVPPYEGRKGENQTPINFTMPLKL